MKKRFMTYLLLFFIPVVGGYLLIEYLARRIPSAYSKVAYQLEENAGKFEVLVLGSSQMRDGINPELISIPMINMASGDQHHSSDRKLYHGLKDRLKNLETVVIEVSYSHFELPHNSKDFWKNSIYLDYYKVNCFERKSWFKDRLQLLSNPKYHAGQMVNHYITKERSSGFNAFGFDTLNYYGRFQNLNYDEEKIAGTNFKINTVPNLEIFEYNHRFFLDFVSEIISDGKEVVVVHPPMYKSYQPRRHPGILKRRDSIVKLAVKRFPGIKVLDLEEDKLNYNVRDYYNQSHLNPDGAKKFSARLNQFLRSD